MARTDKSTSNLWETEPGLFRILHHLSQFTVDGAADPSNHLLPRWWGPGGERGNTLDRAIPWQVEDGTPEHLYLNPPYNREQGAWVLEALWRAQHESATSTLLVPAFTDTEWWHEGALKANRIVELRGRLQFYLKGKPADSARTPNVLLTFHGASAGYVPTRRDAWDWQLAYWQTFGSWPRRFPPMRFRGTSVEQLTSLVA